MLPDLALVTVVLSMLVMLARFNKLLQNLVTQILARNMTGSLRAARGTRRPQALPGSE